jgi:hypothetical protein
MEAAGSNRQVWRGGYSVRSHTWNSRAEMGSTGKLPREHIAEGREVVPSSLGDLCSGGLKHCQLNVHSGLMLWLGSLHPCPIDTSQIPSFPHSLPPRSRGRPPKHLLLDLLPHPELVHSLPCADSALRKTVPKHLSPILGRPLRSCPSRILGIRC